MITLQRETTEYVYLGITGDVPASDTEVAFLAPASRPEEADWETAILIEDDSNPLWADATGSGATGDYFLARLVGSFGENDVVLTPGDYQVWVRLTDTVERPVRIAPVALVIA